MDAADLMQQAEAEVKAQQSKTEEVDFNIAPTEEEIEGTKQEEEAAAAMLPQSQAPDATAAPAAQASTSSDSTATSEEIQAGHVIRRAHRE